jgi:hypothetical protein
VEPYEDSFQDFKVVEASRRARHWEVSRERGPVSKYRWKKMSKMFAGSFLSITMESSRMLRAGKKI